MSSYGAVVVLVEGPTEQRFIKNLLAPYMFDRGVFLTPIILDKPGEKGGDVKFARAQNDIEKHVKQRRDTWITLMVDYYGIKSDWPGYADSKQASLHTRKAQIMNEATASAVAELFPEYAPDKRFIPYVSMHETEALYFSNPAILAEKLEVSQKLIDDILAKSGEPEKINDDSQTAPSKRLEQLSARFKKTSTGLAIANAVGIERMREACPLFNEWVAKLEHLTTADAK